MEFLKEFYLMLKIRKKYWLTPVIITLVVLSAVIFYSQTLSVNFIYTLF